MTEDEAQTKWCPFGRVYSDKGGYNRTEARVADGPSKCIASNCMAWRWVKDPLVDFVADGKTITQPTTKHGFCGLAGPL